jgi:hypothetical protein
LQQQRSDLHNNQFTGPVPAIESFAFAISLGILDLSHNQLSGPVADSFTNAKALSIFKVNDNNLSGRVPYSLTWCRNLTVVDVGNNRFSGPIPPLLAPNLKIFNAENNCVVGEAPTNFTL